MATLVSHPSLPGTENFWSSAFEAGPAAAMPATVSTIQAMTTVRLWASTQRVSDDKVFLLSQLGPPGGAKLVAQPAANRHVNGADVERRALLCRLPRCRTAVIRGPILGARAYPSG